MRSEFGIILVLTQFLVLACGGSLGDAEDVVLVHNRKEVWVVSLTHKTVIYYNQSFEEIGAVTADGRRNRLYVADNLKSWKCPECSQYQPGAIVRFNYNKLSNQGGPSQTPTYSVSNTTAIISGYKIRLGAFYLERTHISSLAVDPTTGYLYWSDVGLGTIAVCSPDGSYVHVVNHGLNRPSGLTIKSSLFWTEVHDPKWQISSANLDGTNEHRIIELQVDATQFPMPDGTFVIDKASGIVPTGGASGRVFWYNSTTLASSTFSGKDIQHWSLNFSRTGVSYINGNIALVADTPEVDGEAEISLSIYSFILAPLLVKNQGSVELSFLDEITLKQGFQHRYGLKFQIVTGLSRQVGRVLQYDLGTLRQCMNTCHLCLSGLSDAIQCYCNMFGRERVKEYVCSAPRLAKSRDLFFHVQGRVVLVSNFYNLGKITPTVICISSKPVAVTYDSERQLVYIVDAALRRMLVVDLYNRADRLVTISASETFSWLAIKQLFYEHSSGNLYALKSLSFGEHGVEYSLSTISILKLQATHVTELVVATGSNLQCFWIDSGHGKFYYVSISAKPSIIHCSLDGSGCRTLNTRLALSHPLSVFTTPGKVHLIDKKLKRLYLYTHLLSSSEWSLDFSVHSFAERVIISGSNMYLFHSFECSGSDCQQSKSTLQVVDIGGGNTIRTVNNLQLGLLNHLSAASFRLDNGAKCRSGCRQCSRSSAYLHSPRVCSINDLCIATLANRTKCVCQNTVLLPSPLCPFQKQLATGIFVLDAQKVRTISDDYKAVFSHEISLVRRTEGYVVHQLLQVKSFLPWKRRELLLFTTISSPGQIMFMNITKFGLRPSPVGYTFSRTPRLWQHVSMYGNDMLVISVPTETRAKFGNTLHHKHHADRTPGSLDVLLLFDMNTHSGDDYPDFGSTTFKITVPLLTSNFLVDEKSAKAFWVQGSPASLMRVDISAAIVADGGVDQPFNGGPSLKSRSNLEPLNPHKLLNVNSATALSLYKTTLYALDNRNDVIIECRSATDRVPDCSTEHTALPGISGIHALSHNLFLMLDTLKRSLILVSTEGDIGTIRTGFLFPTSFLVLPEVRLSAQWCAEKGSFSCRGRCAVLMWQSSVCGDSMCRHQVCMDKRGDLEPGLVIPQVRFVYCPAPVFQLTDGDYAMIHIPPPIVDGGELISSSVPQKFFVGKTSVDFFAKSTNPNANNQTATCSVVVTVKATKLKDFCEEPIIYGGVVRCGKGQRDCKIFCNRDFELAIPESLNNYMCEGGSWRPHIKESYRTTACVIPEVPITYRVAYHLKANVSGTCQSEPRFSQLVVDAFISRLSAKKLCPFQRTPAVPHAVLCKRGQVMVKCSGGQANLTSFPIDLTLLVDLANTTSPKRSQALIDRYRITLKSYLQKLITLSTPRLRNSVKARLDEDAVQVIDQCQPGHGLIGGYCTVCNPGSRYSNHTCISCMPGTYQPFHGQPECIACGTFKTSGYGSFTEEQCVFNLPVWLLVVVIAVGILLIISVFVFVCVICWRRKHFREKFIVRVHKDRQPVSQDLVAETRPVSTAHYSQPYDRSIPESVAFIPDLERRPKAEPVSMTQYSRPYDRSIPERVAFIPRSGSPTAAPSS